MNSKTHFIDRPEQMSQLIGQIYDAALNPALWPSVMQGIASAQASPKALLLTLFVRPNEGGFQFSANISPSFLEQYDTRYAPMDAWTGAGLTKGVFQEGNVALDSDLIPFEELSKTEYYRDFLCHADVAKLAVGIVFGPETQPFPVTTLSAYRSLKDPPFGDPERRLHRILVSHVSRALGVMLRLRDAELRIAASLHALDRLSVATFLFGAQGDVVYHNPAAERILAGHDSLHIARQDGKGVRYLVSRLPTTSKAISRAIAETLDSDAIEVAHFSRVIPIPSATPETRFVFQIAPLPCRNDFGVDNNIPRAIAFLSSPSSINGLAPEILQRIYDLTAAEARLAVALFAGTSLRDAAAKLRISSHTARTQLKAVFAKTGTHRQSELLKFLASISTTTVSL